MEWTFRRGIKCTYLSGTATDISHDFGRYGYRMMVQNATAGYIFLTAAPDDESTYGHLRSSCITRNGGIPFGIPWDVPPGGSAVYYFRRSAACSGLQGWFSIRSSAEAVSDSTDFQQFWFGNTDGALEYHGVNSIWPHSLVGARGDYLLTVRGSEFVGGATFRTRGYQRPEYANWPGQSPIARRFGLGGTSVRINNLPAPIFYSTPGVIPQPFVIGACFSDGDPPEGDVGLHTFRDKEQQRRLAHPKLRHVVQLARLSERRVLVTEDHNFGELVYGTRLHLGQRAS